MITDSLLIGNSAGAGSSPENDGDGGNGGTGGAIYTGGGVLNLMSSTVINNFAGQGGPGTGSGVAGTDGIGGVYFESIDAPIVVNSILWGNRLNEMDPSQELTHQISPGAAVRYSCITGWTPVSDGNIAINPALDLITFVPTAASPVLNAGESTLLPRDDADLDTDSDTAESLPVDLAGNPRLVGSAVDMGAYEVQ